MDSAARFASGSACNAESSVRGRYSAEASRDRLDSASSSFTVPIASAAARSSSALTVTMRSLGPAACPAAVASPACCSSAWLAGVPMNSATSRTATRARTCAEMRISTTES